MTGPYPDGTIGEDDAVQLEQLADRIGMAGLDVEADELRWIAMNVRDHVRRADARIERQT